MNSSAQHYQLPVDPTLFLTFLAVAKVGKIAGASQILNLSQPAVTAQIRKLEEQIGVTLFRRSVKGVELTAEGLSLQEKAQRIVELIDTSISEIKQTQEPEGHLSIAASTTIGSHVLPAFLIQFTKRFQKVSLNLSIGNSDEVIKLVRAGECPLGLVEGISKAAGIRTQKFLFDELIPVSSPLVATGIRHVSQLSKVPILWRERGSGTRAVVEKALLQMSVPKKKLLSRFELGSTEAIITAACEGLGIAFVSRWSIKQELNSGTLKIIPIPEIHIPRIFSWVIPSGGLSGSAKSFFEFAEKTKLQSI